MKSRARPSARSKSTDIFDFLLLVTSDSFHVRVIGFLLSENMGVAVGISLLSCQQIETCGSSGLETCKLFCHLLCDNTAKNLKQFSARLKLNWIEYLGEFLPPNLEGGASI